MASDRDSASVSPDSPPEAPKMVSVTIDGKTHLFPVGMTLLEACHQVGAKVPFFCWHPGLSVPAVCRQCLVEVRGLPKPVPSCYTRVTEKMEVLTNSSKALAVRKQMLEFTLLNHPIDCPICDKAGECVLQKHYFDWDAAYARNDGSKVRKAKVVDVGKHIVLDQERCILCSRCVRVCDEVARSPDLGMAFRGDEQVLTTAPGRRLDNPYSLNTVDVCPVGALTAKDFRFSARAWELSAMPSICPGCATGCNIEIHFTRNQIKRLVPRAHPTINKYWMCDDGRFTYKAVHQNRLTAPMVDGAVCDWTTALERAAALLRETSGPSRAGIPSKTGVVFSAQSTNEDLNALARLAQDHLQIERSYLVGVEDGWSDDILVSADKSPNQTGARGFAGSLLRSRVDLRRDLEAGALTALLVLDGRGLLGPLEKLQGLVVLASHRTAVSEAAQVVLPVPTWAEVDGTFTNRQGKTQRLYAALARPGQARPGWQVLVQLAALLGLALQMADAREAFARACEKVAFMNLADWGEARSPVQLRFANTRG